MDHNDSCSGQRIENVINYLELTQNFPLYLPCTYNHVHNIMIMVELNPVRNFQGLFTIVPLGTRMLLYIVLYCKI